MVFNPFGNELALVWDLIAMFISIFFVLLVVIANALLEKSGKVSSVVTRKIVHIFAAPVFLLTWLFYSGTIFSRFTAMIVPLLFVLLFVGIGTGKIQNDQFVNSMSRTGDSKELLQGTLYYSVVMLLVTVLWFYIQLDGNGNPAGIVLMGCLAGGDGLADIFGRKYGGDKKFGLKGSEKTVIGTIGMFIGSFLFSLILVLIFSLAVPNFNLIGLILSVLIISAVATLVEAFSPKGFDNITIPISVIIVIILLSLGGSGGLWPYALIAF